MTSDDLSQMVEAGPRLVNAIHSSSRALQHAMLGTARAVALSCSVLSYGAHKLQAAQARRAERQPPPQPRQTRQTLLPLLVDEEHPQPHSHAVSEGTPITAPAAAEFIRASLEVDGGASAAPATAPASPGSPKGIGGGGGKGAQIRQGLETTRDNKGAQIRQGLETTRDNKGAQIRQGLEMTRAYLQHVALVSDCIGRSVLHGGKHVLRYRDDL